MKKSPKAAKAGSGMADMLSVSTVSKHHNVKQYRYEDGFVSPDKTLSKHGDIVQRYDSTKEYNRHCELMLLQKAGKITDLSCQVVLEVSPQFTDREGKLHRAVNYKADFVYKENGQEIVEDVKGLDKKTGTYQTTEAFNIKWKLLQSRYRDKIFRLY